MTVEGVPRKSRGRQNQTYNPLKSYDCVFQPLIGSAQASASEGKNPGTTYRSWKDSDNEQA